MDSFGSRSFGGVGDVFACTFGMVEFEKSTSKTAYGFVHKFLICLWIERTMQSTMIFIKMLQGLQAIAQIDGVKSAVHKVIDGFPVLWFALWRALYQRKYNLVGQQALGFHTWTWFHKED